jgi:hypothetical protein
MIIPCTERYCKTEEIIYDFYTKYVGTKTLGTTKKQGKRESVAGE